MSAGRQRPTWVDTVCESLQAEVDAPGGLRWAFIPEDEQLIIAPAVVELHGGAHDGAEVFPFYTVEINSLLRLFEELPSVVFSSRNGECSIEGTIEGATVWILFQTEPFEDESPSFTVKDGIWKERRDD